MLGEEVRSNSLSLSEIQWPFHNYAKPSEGGRLKFIQIDSRSALIGLLNGGHGEPTEIRSKLRFVSLLRVM